MKKRVDFNDLGGPDVVLLMALRAGKSYEAAAKIAGLTRGQGDYRAQIARKEGMRVSPRDYRNSANLGDMRIQTYLKTIGQLDRTIKDINKHLAKHNRRVLRRRKNGR